MDALLGFALTTAALAGVSLGHAAAGLLLAVPPDDRPFRRPPPGFARPVWPGARVMGHYLRRLVPSRWLERVRPSLKRAELQGRVDADEWVGVIAAYAVVGALGGAAFAAGFDLEYPAPVLVGAGFGALFPVLKLRDLAARREAAIRRELPTYLDVLTLAVESGCSLATAIGHATEKAPDGALRRGLQRLLGEVRAGRSRVEALRSFEDWMAEPGVTALVGALVQAEKTGAGLGPVLRAQAAQRTQERFARAEKLAMQAPVRMLAPLILCIFPCTFLVLGFPIALRLMEGF
ncbi:MAG: type II secretion system F family protein [Steroidobacteraceae bacterium]|jgi:tight adherence protein C|nr:type II secretion system F family protein [Steroidobacteraceae bacterium]